MKQIGVASFPICLINNFLDNASEMFGKWGMSTHMDEKEHLCSGLVPKPEGGDALKKEK